MRLGAALFGGIFMTGRLCSASSFDVSHGLHRRHADVHDRMRRDADNAVHELGKRAGSVSQGGVFGAPNGVWPTVVVPPGFTLAAGVEITPIPGASNTFASVPTGTAVAAPQESANAVNVDPTKWNAQAEQACMTSVMNLKGNASNPAGLAVCYNVPYLDEAKGTFEAELRVYNISMPSGDFVGVTPAMMMVTLQYQGATIQTSNGTLPVKRDLVELEERQMMATPTGTAMPPSGAMPQGIMMPSEVAVRKYIGQINKNLMVPGMNITTFQPLLIPQIAITAMNPTTGQQVNTSLSTADSSFVAGVFSKAAGNITDPKSLLGNPQEQLAAAAAGLPTPFVVPGLALNVFPVGLIVTSVWMVLFFGFVGMGTLGRIQFRDQYRRAIRAQKEESQRRI